MRDNHKWYLPKLYLAMCWAGPGLGPGRAKPDDKNLVQAQPSPTKYP
jgi:hypothetical protein